MPAMLGMRAFALAADRASGRVYCGADGVFVGDVPLLKHSGAPGGWLVRAIEELNGQLTKLYRLPIDVAAKANALALIAHALNRGDLAMAAIAAVQMQLPDPPPLSKSNETTEEILRRAADLHRSDLLKYGDWNPEKHPRTGIPPNPGWFATVDGSVERPWRVAANDLPDEEEDEINPLLSEGPHREDELRPLQIMPRGLPPIPGGLWRPPLSTRPAPEGLSPGGPRSPAVAPGTAQPRLPFPGGLPPPNEAPTIPSEASPALPAEIAPAAAEGAGPPRLGSFAVPDNLTFGTTLFGNYAHDETASLLKQLYPGVPFILRVLPGQQGVDVEIPEYWIPRVGHQFMEIKPRTRSGEATLRQQMQRWGLEEVQPLTYDANGNVYYGFR